LDVCEHLARSPRGLRAGPVILRELPRLARHHAGGEVRISPSRGRDAFDVIHTASVAGRAYDGGTDHASTPCGVRGRTRMQRSSAMTETLSRGAANQAGARVDGDAYAKAADFLPLDGIDHVEFWVGNARQAAAYYRALWGFTPVAFRGLETKVRDRASYVMVQNDIRFVFTAPLTPDGEIAEHVREHGDGAHDLAFRVADVASAWRARTPPVAAAAHATPFCLRRQG